jgi:hypothetical protein
LAAAEARPVGHGRRGIAAARRQRKHDGVDGCGGWRQPMCTEDDR